MPMVPTFQGGIPQVRDNGGSNVTPLRQPNVGFDYNRLMRDAMKPVDEFSQSLTEALRINHARTVKAESDDAERQVIDAINARMNGDGGFMTQQGKNAMDAFKPTVDAMTADVDKIVGSLQPQVREAIGSRIQDRLSSAVTQAQRWNGQQTRQYHFSSSEARVQTLMSDADNHYAELPYLQKTWGSIAQEIDYQVSMLGLPAEQAKLMKEKSYDLFQARRFEAWGADNPVQALQVFRSQRPNVSADIANKIEAGLFAKSRDTLALGLAQRPIEYDEKGDIKNLAWMDDPGKATGDAFVDSLKTDQRLSVVLRARQLRTQMIQARSDEFKQEVSNNLAETLMGNSPQPLTADQFVEAYGPKAGAKRFEQYLLDYSDNQFRFEARGLSKEEIEAELKASKPRSGDANFSAAMKTWNAKKTAAEKIIKDRNDDPIQFAVDASDGDVPTIKDWSQEQAFKDLVNRVSLAQQVHGRWKTEPVLLTKDELDGLSRQFDLLDASGQSDFAAQLYKSLKAPASDEDGVTADDFGIGTLVSQLSGNKASKKLATALMLMSDSAPAFGKAYLLGKQLLADGNAQVNEKYGGDIAWFNEKIGTNAESVGVFDETVDADLARDAFMGVFAFQQQDGGTREETLESVFGNIVDYNGKKIILPRRRTNNEAYSGDAFWWFTRDFNDLIDHTVKRISEEKGQVVFEGFRYDKATFARLIRDRQLQTVGNGRYLVKSDDSSGYAKNVDGSNFVLDVLVR